jgi:hypothetical protein
MNFRNRVYQHNWNLRLTRGRLHDKQGRAEGWNILILVIMVIIRSMIYRRESVLMMLKSKVWAVVAIVISVLITLALGAVIYFLIQAQRSVII